MIRHRLLLHFLIIVVCVSCSTQNSTLQSPQNIQPTEIFGTSTQQKIREDRTQTPNHTANNDSTFPEVESTSTSHVLIDPKHIEYFSHINYKINASYEYQNKTIHVQELISYPVDIIYLDNIYLINEIGKNSPDFMIINLKLDDNYVNNYINSPGLLEIPLEKIFETKTTVKVFIEYTASLPFRPGKYGYTKNQDNFGDWYLFVPPFLPESGWVINNESIVGEYLNYPIASFSINFELLNAPKDIVVAASSQPVRQSTNQFNFEIDNARNFVLSLSPKYSVSSLKVEQTTIFSYFYPEHHDSGTAALDAAAKAYKLYSDSFGKIGLESLSIVEGDFTDGMEYHGFFFLGQEYYWEYTGDQKSYLTTIAAHETAHQWFYSLVANDQANDPWLDEAICTYLEQIFYEFYYPDLIPWWWQYRVLRFNPSGWVNSSVYAYNNFRSYVDAVYLRGALYLDDLRALMGDKDFFSAINTYILKNFYGFASTQSFFSSIKSNTSIDIQNLNSVYFIDID